MLITLEVINTTFCELIPVPVNNVLTKDGFNVLADWSEQQEWWQEFAKINGIGLDWRNSHMGDPYLFALTLFRFIKQMR